MALIGWMVVAVMVMVSCLLYDELLQGGSGFLHLPTLYTPAGSGGGLACDTIAYLLRQTHTIYLNRHSLGGASAPFVPWIASLPSNMDV